MKTRLAILMLVASIALAQDVQVQKKPPQKPQAKATTVQKTQPRPKPDDSLYVDPVTPWLSFLIWLVVGSVTCGVGWVVYWFIYGIRGNYMYYSAFVKNKQLAA